MKTLNCMHEGDWMCSDCAKCGLCCTCTDHEPGDSKIIHVNSRAAQDTWRRTIWKDRVLAGTPVKVDRPEHPDQVVT